MYPLVVLLSLKAEMMLLTDCALLLLVLVLVLLT